MVCEIEAGMRRVRRMVMRSRIVREKRMKAVETVRQWPAEWPLRRTPDQGPTV